MAVYYAGFIPSGDGYAVLFPNFPGCNSQGETLEEAVSMAAEALEGHIAAMLDDGDAMPVPGNRQDARESLRAQFAALELGPLPDGTELHPVPVSDFNTRVKKVAVSFSSYRLDMIDRKAKMLGMTRSGFLGAAAEAYSVQVE
ncbi:MAG: type II toxin-antitoxin system HicB family antitoxin [Desulfovibrio sp.]|jgi:predicted RNase H-like HicB family nuclease|nr:type II toxin-antitoxin system HicB family antitoxin [Desulfovibrio sp.]